MRRAVLFLVVSIALAVLPFSVVRCSEPVTTQASPREPNFVYIIADDMRYDDLAYMPKTRHLIGSQGLTFENAYVPLGVCCPSRASVLTGMYTHNHNVWSNKYGPEGGWEDFRTQARCRAHASARQGHAILQPQLHDAGPDSPDGLGRELRAIRRAAHLCSPGHEELFMFLPEAERHGLATGHQFWFGRPFPGGGLSYNRAITPTGLITSDARDMSRYLIAQLNEGRYDGARVLSSEGIARLHRGGANMGQPDVSYAMGWIDGEMGGVPVVWHNGDTGDFHATMILVPEGQWGVVLLMSGSNDLRGSMDTTANGVVARLVGVEPPPPPGLLQETFLVTLLVILAVGVLQVFGIVRSVVLMRRWRTHPAQRPRGIVRVGLPLVLNLLWAAILSVGLPRIVGVPLWLVANPRIDLGLLVVLSGGVALIWGIVLRPMLALLALRTKGAPGDAGTSKKAEALVQA